MSFAIRLALVFCAVTSFASAQNIITTYAGSDWVFPGAGKPAINAPLIQVSGVAADAAGNIYMSDASAAQVYKVDRNGILTIVAGNGSSGYSGDGGPATAAALYAPRSIAVDSSGNLHRR